MHIRVLGGSIAIHHPTWTNSYDFQNKIKIIEKQIHTHTHTHTASVEKEPKRNETKRRQKAKERKNKKRKLNKSRCCQWLYRVCCDTVFSWMRQKEITPFKTKPKTRCDFTHRSYFIFLSHVAAGFFCTLVISVLVWLAVLCQCAYADAFWLFRFYVLILCPLPFN